MTTRRFLLGVCTAPVAVGIAAAQQMPRTSTEKIKGSATEKTEKLSGTVTYVEGQRLVVKMANGELRTFETPENRRFIIDGQELRTRELRSGTKLNATVTTTTTPVTERTTTVGTGKVWYVAGTTVILTLPNNENRMYKVKDSYRFNVNGQKASVFELKKGMVVSAEKIVEEPKVEIASDVAVTGTAPKAPRTEVAKAGTHACPPAPARPRLRLPLRLPLRPPSPLRLLPRCRTRAARST